MIERWQPEQVRFGDYYAWRRMTADHRAQKWVWEWLTERGWRRVRGGCQKNRKPADTLMLRVVGVAAEGACRDIAATRPNCPRGAWDDQQKRQNIVALVKKDVRDV